jgi:ankyrin repeat protein
MKAVYEETNMHVYQFFRAMNEKDYSLMEKLLEEGHIDLNKLYRKGGNPRRCMAAIAIINKNNEVFEFLMKRTDPNLYSRNSILHCAVSIGEYSQVKFILEMGADPNLSGEGEGPFAFPIFVSTYENIEKIKLLLDYKADPNTINFDGENLLDILVGIYKNVLVNKKVEEVIEKMELLLEKGTFPSEKFFSTFEGTEYYERFIIYKYPNKKGLIPSMKEVSSSEKLDL